MAEKGQVFFQVLVGRAVEIMCLSYSELLPLSETILFGSLLCDWGFYTGRIQAYTASGLVLMKVSVESVLFHPLCVLALLHQFSHRSCIRYSLSHYQGDSTWS